MQPEEIKAIRNKLGVSQTILANRLGVSQNTVARWELGQRKPGGPTVILLRQLAEEAKTAPEQ